MQIRWVINCKLNWLNKRKKSNTMQSIWLEVDQKLIKFHKPRILNCMLSLLVINFWSKKNYNRISTLSFRYVINSRLLLAQIILSITKLMEESLFLPRFLSHYHIQNSLLKFSRHKFSTIIFADIFLIIIWVN